MVTQRELGGEEAPCLETRNDDGPAEVIAAGADLAVPVPVLMLISLADADAAKREAAARQRHESEREKMFFMLVK